MSTSASAWVEDFGSDGQGLASLLLVQRNMCLARFVAAVRVLTQEYPEEPGVRHLAESYALAKRLPSRALAVAFADPTFAYWIHVTAGLIGRLRNREPIPPSDVPHLADLALAQHPLHSHLRDINRFVAAAALAARVHIAIDCALIEGEVCLPGLGLVIQVAGISEVIRIEVMDNPQCCLRLGNGTTFAVDELLALTDSERIAPARINGAILLPRVRGTSGRILLNSKDPYYRLAWILQQRFPGGLAAGEVSEDDLRRWHPTLRAALALLLKVWPEMEAGISQWVHTIVPVISPLVDKSISCTAQSFWGAVLCSLDAEVCLAETLVHEFSHSLLYALMDQHGILAEDCPRQETYYSPWRPDARPLSGVLHAVFVFERVAGFYDHYFRLQPGADAYRHRYASIVGRLVIGLRTLEANARFNREGQAFLARLSAGIEKHRGPGLASLDAASRAELAEHLSSWEKRYPNYSVPAFVL